jgi:hypothetical protein
MSDTITTTDSNGPGGRPDKRSQGGGAPGAGPKGPEKDDRGKKARKGPVVFGTVILILLVGAGLVLGARWLLDTINFVSTDDAAIDGDHVNVSAKTLGRIASLLAA